MSLKIARITAPRTTAVKLYETGGNGEQEEIILNIRHKRLTPTIGRQIDEISNSVAKEIADYWDEKPKAKGNKKDQPPVRNATVEQLALLVEYTDILGEDGNVLPPTKETFEQLPGNVLLAMMDAINSSVVPEKSSPRTKGLVYDRRQNKIPSAPAKIEILRAGFADRTKPDRDRNELG